MRDPVSLTVVGRRSSGSPEYPTYDARRNVRGINHLFITNVDRGLEGFEILSHDLSLPVDAT